MIHSPDIEHRLLPPGPPVQQLVSWKRSCAPGGKTFGINRDQRKNLLLLQRIPLFPVCVRSFFPLRRIATSPRACPVSRPECFFFFVGKTGGFDVVADGLMTSVEVLVFPWRCFPPPHSFYRRWKGEAEVGRLSFFSCQRQMTRAVERRALWLPGALGIISLSPSEADWTGLLA